MVAHLADRGAAAVVVLVAECRAGAGFLRVPASLVITADLELGAVALVLHGGAGRRGAFLAGRAAVRSRCAGGDRVVAAVGPLAHAQHGAIAMKVRGLAN